MPSTLTARLPDDIATPLGDLCADRGTTKTELVITALREYLDKHKPRPTAYELAMQILASYPAAEKGLPQIQAVDAKKILRAKFSAKARAR